MSGYPLRNPYRRLRSGEDFDAAATPHVCEECGAEDDCLPVLQLDVDDFTAEAECFCGGMMVPKEGK